MFTVSLYKDPSLTDTVKRRTGLPVNNFYTAVNVDVGNFSSKNMFVDNSFEISVPYATAQTANYCSVSFGTPPMTTVGAITGVEYINDQNTRITYVVDAFSSAKTSNLITNMQGLCERTHLDYTTPQSFANLQSEPFSPSDVMRADSDSTQALNDVLEAFEGVPLNDGTAGGWYNGLSVVVTVSSAVMKYLGDPPEFSNYSDLTIGDGIQLITNFDFYTGDTTPHSGGIYKGTPLVFNSIEWAKVFLREMLDGKGFRTILPADGYDNDGVIRRPVYTPLSSGGGNSFHSISNDEGLEMEALRFITSEDFFSAYIIPTKFCELNANIISSYGNSLKIMPTLADFHGLKEESNTMSKLLTYPYCYSKIVTANGDTVELIPQTMHRRNGAWGNNSEILLDLKYLGGDTPALMGRFVPGFAEPSTASNRTVGEWFTVRSYPSISLSMDTSLNAQQVQELTNKRKISAIAVNAVETAKLNSPFKQGYLDGVSSMGNYSENQGALSKLAYHTGTFLSGLTPNHPLLSDSNALSVQNATREVNAGNVLSPERGIITGTGNISQLSTPGFAFYACGASNTENFSFARYFEMFGQSCNCIISPLTNAGSIWSGLATITTFNARTFYKFSYIFVTGNVPIPWKRKIQELFESGVYLIA